MTVKFQSFPGMDDVLPAEVEKWRWVEDQFRMKFEILGYQEIRTPILEPTELFTRSIGEASDIVHKEMYTFEDRGQRSMTLRPEMTASVARAVIQNGLLKTSKSLKLYYLGPMFRSERPQAGRKRQFHQLGAEIVNESARADFAIIRDLFYFLKDDILLSTLSLRMNDLSEGAGPKKPLLQAALKKYFEKHKPELCKDCQYRLEKNVLRIFDCKKNTCQPIIEGVAWEEIAPLGDSFRALMQAFQSEGIPVKVDRRLVRGLDYYTGIVFEVTAAGLGAQDAVAGGGRYDHLYEQLGAAGTPCTGFSIGIERLLISLEKSAASFVKKIHENQIYFALLGSDADSKQIQTLAMNTALSLQRFGFRAVLGDAALGLSEHLKRANKMDAKYVIIVGSNEVQNKKWTVKDMGSNGQQMEVESGRLLAHLKGSEVI